MRKFMPTEIDLCKKIAEKEMVDLKIGMYVYRKFDDSVQLICRLDEENKDIHTAVPKTEDSETKNIGLGRMYWNNLEGGWLTPLWQEHDCLEFLRERCKHHVLLIHEEDELVLRVITLWVNGLNAACFRASTLYLIGPQFMKIIGWCPSFRITVAESPAIYFALHCLATTSKLRAERW